MCAVLFTVVRFPNTNCLAGSSKTGVCFTLAQCRQLRGLASGACAQGFGVCCLIHRRTGVCQVRLDLEDFVVGRPLAGTCSGGSMVVRGYNVNARVPRLCGRNSGQHLYVDINDHSGPLQLDLETSGTGEERWRIRVAQIECSNPARPPSNCLQYFTSPTGGVWESFNYEPRLPPGESGGYLNGLDYAVCWARGPGCSLRLSTAGPLGIFNADPESGSPTVPNARAGSGRMDCPRDYLLVGESRLCGTRLNPESGHPAVDVPVLGRWTPSTSVVVTYTIRGNPS
ncbi:hypothetical protein LAZ67_6000407 [Cordylochernes scorpioides]|uniref:CUB domain-containing protein n=1 Tax=Cordylochernes scorpioides TaxID=51811 RepID=A0ABY6KIK3_9ARAC|nr:hypothetical protein LAZ67_6000407 [Cordylochernes scorpioides]